jgi:excisionase family DNA binding protein
MERHPALLSVSEAAARLAVSPRRVRQLIDEGCLEASLVGRNWLVDRRSVEQRRLQGPSGGRPFSLHRAWSIAQLADQAVEGLAHQVSQHPGDVLLHQEQALLGERLALVKDLLADMDPAGIVASRRRRVALQRELQEALDALRDYERRERLASSLWNNPLLHSAHLHGGSRSVWHERAAASMSWTRADRAAIRRLRNGLAHDQRLDSKGLASFRNRVVEVQGYYGHPSVLHPLSGDHLLRSSGAHAARQYGADVVPGDHLDAYVAPDLVGELVDGYGLRASSLGDSNIIFRLVPDLPLHDGPAPRLLVAADLLESGDPRARQSAFQMLEIVWAAIDWYDE